MRFIRNCPFTSIQIHYLTHSCTITFNIIFSWLGLVNILLFQPPKVFFQVSLDLAWIVSRKYVSSSTVYTFHCFASPLYKYSQSQSHSSSHCWLHGTISPHITTITWLRYTPAVPSGVLVPSPWHYWCSQIGRSMLSFLFFFSGRLKFQLTSILYRTA